MLCVCADSDKLRGTQDVGSVRTQRLVTNLSNNLVIQRNKGEVSHVQNVNPLTNNVFNRDTINSNPEIKIKLVINC